MQKSNNKTSKFILAFKKSKLWWGHRKTWIKVLLVAASLFVILILLMVGVAWYYRHTQKHHSIEYGVSFSVAYAEELGLDWRANFTSLLDDLKFKKLRLMSFWNRHESKNNQYNFTELDWQMDEAAKRNAKIMLTVGLRQPRWPECHVPVWATDLSGAEFEKELLDYITVVVQRYSAHPALEKFQLENEYFNRNFGLCDQYGYDRDRLIDELNLVQNVDGGHHPIVISFSDQLGTPLRGPVPDIYASSLYRGNYVKYIGNFSYPISSHFYAAKAQIIRWLHGREVFIHELQLEPWGPRATAQLSDNEQRKYMSLEQMHDNLLFARRTGMKEIYLWGGEWWYWRKEHHADPSQWETVREAIKLTDPVSSIFN